MTAREKQLTEALARAVRILRGCKKQIEVSKSSIAPLAVRVVTRAVTDCEAVLERVDG